MSTPSTPLTSQALASAATHEPPSSDREGTNSSRCSSTGNAVELDSDPSCADEADVQANIEELQREVEDCPLQWHDDHWDELHDYEPVYDMEHDNNREALRWNKYNTPNEKLYEDPNTKQWLNELANLRPSDFPTLVFGGRRKYVNTDIPLFRDDDTGDEYQIALHLSRGLVYAFCPENSLPLQEVSWPPLARLLYHASPAERKMPQDGSGLPRFGIALGVLSMRSTHRFPNSSRGTPLEYTDYHVFLDAESEAMPLWILCSRRTLEERTQVCNGHNRGNLPMFGGAMQFEEYGYDAACILDSVHKLGPGERPSYQEACELVRRTRAVVDPLVTDAPSSKMEQLIQGSAPNPNP